MSYNHRQSPMNTATPSGRDRAGAPTSGYKPYPSSHQAERIITTTSSRSPVSKREIANSIPKPPRVNKELDVLAKANEILQKSSKFTAEAYSADSLQPSSLMDIPSNSRTLTPTSSKVLDKADEILKRSAAYSKETTYGSKRNEPSNKVERPNRTPDTRLGTEMPVSNNYRNEGLGSNTKADTGKTKNKMNDIMSKVEEALQKSYQLTSGVSLSRNDIRNMADNIDLETAHFQQRRRSQDMREVERYQEHNKNTRYETPNREIPEPKNVRKSPEQRSGRSKSPRKTPGRDKGAGETKVPHKIKEAYNESLRKSQEALRKSEHAEMRKSGFKQKSPPGNRTTTQREKENNMESSFVMERRLNERATVTPSETDHGKDVEVKEGPPMPGIYLPKRGKKPKYVEEFYEDGTMYKGEKIKDSKQGRGEFMYVDGSKYEGEWEHDKKSGYGMQYFSNGNIQYDGEWKDDAYHGNGILMNEEAQTQEGFDYHDFSTLGGYWVKYEGEFLNGTINGLGTLMLYNNERFVGKFKANKVHGTGVFHQSNGDTVSGEWQENKFVRML